MAVGGWGDTPPSNPTPSNRTNINSQNTPEEKIVFLKPEDFMKPPAKASNKQPSSDSDKQHSDNIKKSKKGNIHFIDIADDSSEDQNQVPDMNMGRPPRQTPRDMRTPRDRPTPREARTPRDASPRRPILRQVSGPRGESSEDVSPLNTARSRGTVTFASPKSPTPEEEMVGIRDRLKHFSQQKERLRYAICFQSLAEKIQICINLILAKSNIELSYSIVYGLL